MKFKCRIKMNVAIFNKNLEIEGFSIDPGEIIEVDSISDLLTGHGSRSSSIAEITYKGMNLSTNTTTLMACFEPIEEEPKVFLSTDDNTFIDITNKALKINKKDQEQ